MKDIWNNRKTRGIIFLVFYIMLFSYIFIVYGGRSEKIILPDNKPPKVEKKVYNNYEYDYIYNNQIIHAIKYNDVIEFKISDLDYYYINNKCYKLENEKFIEIENPLKYNFDYISNLDDIKKISDLVKTTKYVDGTIEENYDVNFAQLLNIFGVQEEVDAKKMINYSIFIFNEEISELVFNDLDVKIKYTSFNDVAEINIDYEFYESES